MYNEHLKDLYKVAGPYVISAIRRRSAMRRAYIPEETDNELLLENDAADDLQDDFDDEA